MKNLLNSDIHIYDDSLSIHIRFIRHLLSLIFNEILNSKGWRLKFEPKVVYAYGMKKLEYFTKHGFSSNVTNVEFS